MVTGTRKENYLVEMTSENHKIMSDVSIKLGGTDTAADPHRILEAALVACTIMTVQMYADRKSWPLVTTNVKVSIDKEGPQTLINRQISFVGELDQEQKNRLLQIADMCPIHKLLMSQISISTQAI